VLGETGAAFQAVFAVEAAAFVWAGLLAVKATGAAAIAQSGKPSVRDGKREQFA
jgi:BCD family chlorophyll transporter-like MFS transporter